MKKYTFLILGLILGDTASKFLAEFFLRENNILLIPNFLSLQYAQNIGIAFSVPITGIFLKLMTVILIFSIFWYYWKEERKKKSLLLNIAYSFIIAGALGNAWERIFRGYVTDFIAVEHFAIFNFADSYISVGACIVIFYYWKYKT